MLRRTMQRLTGAGLAAVLASLVGLAFTNASLAEEKKPPKITYDEHVKPIFRQKCFSCHNPDKKSADLDVTNYTNLMQGGASGTVIEPGDSSASYLYQLVSHAEEPFMPPESPKIADEMIETLRKWIDGGALENAGSTAMIKKKPKFDLALKVAPSERPEVVPMPARLSLEPVVYTDSTTAVTAMATSPWAPLAAIGGQKQVLLYDTSKLELLGALPFPEGTPYVLKFSRNGDLLLAGGGRGGASGKVIVWNIKTGERVIEVGDELDAVLAADISADQTLVALGGPQRVVRIYSTESGQLLHEMRKHTDWIYSVEFSPDGVLLATGDRNGGLMVWEGWTGREYLTLNGHTAGVTGISWRGDSNVVASCSEDGSVRLWEMENGSQVKNWGAHGGGTQSIEFVRDGRLLTCGRDRVAKLWQQDGSQIRAFEAFPDVAVSVTYCDETNRAIAAGWSGEIRVWDANDGKQLGQLSSNPIPLAARFDSAQKSLAEAQAAHQPLLVAYQQAEAAATKIKQDLAAAQKAAEEAQKRVEAATAKMSAAKEDVTKTTAAYEATTKVAAALQPVVPLLQESLAKVQAAAAKGPGDKEVADFSAALAALTGKRAAELDAATKMQAEQAKAVEAAKALQVAAEKELNEANAALAEAKKVMEALAPQVQPADEKQAAAKQALDAAAQQLASAQQQVQRWQSEIEFNRQITELISQRNAAREQVARQQTEHAELLATAEQTAAAAKKAEADLAAAQAAAAEAQKQMAAGQTTVAGTKKAEQDATAAHQAASVQMAKLDEALKPLQQAATSAADVAKKLEGDKELADVATRLQAVFTAKQTELGEMKKGLETKAQAMVAAKQAVADAEKQLVALTAAVEAGQKRVAEMAAAMKTAQQQATTSQQAADAKAKEVAAAEAQLETVKDQIATAREIQRSDS